MVVASSVPRRRRARTLPTRGAVSGVVGGQRCAGVKRGRHPCPPPSWLASSARTSSVDWPSDGAGRSAARRGSRRCAAGSRRPERGPGRVLDVLDHPPLDQVLVGVDLTDRLDRRAGTPAACSHLHQLGAGAGARAGRHLFVDRIDVGDPSARSPNLGSSISSGRPSAVATPRQWRSRCR